MTETYTHSVKFFTCSTLLLGLLIGTAPAARAQRELSGAARTELQLQQLEVTGSVLMIGAHPDDENTALLAWLARGRKVRTAYLSLTRGEGGQNLIGTEQGDAMGVIRTQELLAARRVDGAEQFFTRAIDFGFTKTPQEAFDKWGREEILSDVVWVIRSFRPDLIVLRFSGTPRDGHGQHQASAILGKEAFSAAADPARFPEQLKYVRPWQARRLMWNAFAFTDEQRKEAMKLPGRVEIDPGAYNPVLGYSYREIAGMSRTMHRSQGMGSPEPPGSSKEFLTLVAGDAPHHDVFDGIDLGWSRVAGADSAGALLAQALAAYTPEHPEAAIPSLIAARRVLQGLTDPIAVRKLRDIDETIAQCGGLWLDAAADRPELEPGLKFSIKTTAIDRGPLPVTLASVSVNGSAPAPPAPLASNEPKTASFAEAVAAGAPYSQPYWLVDAKQGDRYTVPDQTLRGRPENPPLYQATFHLELAGAAIDITRPVKYRWVDHQRGELSRPVVVVPAVALTMPGRALVFGSASPRTVEVRVKSTGANDSGSLRLHAPAGWTVEPAERSFQMKDAGQETALQFRLNPPGADSAGLLQATATVNGRDIDVATEPVSYTHIPPQFLFPPADSRLARADIRTLAHNIGYVMGAGDEMPEALRQIGCDVTLLTSTDLAEADLSRFDAIVTGVRAYNVRPDLAANTQRLLDYVNQGGTLVAQYNTVANFNPTDGPALDHIGPYPLKFNHDRVTVEDVPVAFLEPSSPLLHQPNVITEKDFQGWIQERGLYFAHEWDPHYQPLFEMHDPGEKPLKGATLVTRYGKGAFVFTAFSWFRELPAGVPGAYRIFANLLSAGKSE